MKLSLALNSHEGLKVSVLKELTLFTLEQWPETLWSESTQAGKRPHLGHNFGPGFLSKPWIPICCAGSDSPVDRF